MRQSRFVLLSLLVGLSAGQIACRSGPEPSRVPTPHLDATDEPGPAIGLEESEIGFDRQEGRVHGRLPAAGGGRLRLEGEGFVPARELDLDAEGRFEVTSASGSLRGGQVISFTLTGDPPDEAFTRLVPYLRVSLHPGDVVGSMQPRAQIRLRLLDGPDGASLGDGLAIAGDLGRFSTWILDASGKRIVPRTGQRLIAEDGFSRIELDIPDLRARENPDLGQIEGSGLPDALIGLVSWNPWWPGLSGSPEGRVDPAGRWALDPGFDLQPATHFYVTEHLPSGDQLYSCRQLPMLYVSPGRALVEVQTLWEVEAELELLREGRTIANATGGGAWSGNLGLILRDAAGNPAPTLPGDRLRALLDGRPIELEVGRLEAELNPSSGRILGRAAPDAELDLALPERPLERWTRADGSGRFELDASEWLDDGGLRPGVRIEVYQRTPTGHNLRQRFEGIFLEAGLGEGSLEGRAQAGSRLEIRRETPNGAVDELSVDVGLDGRWQARLPSDAELLATGDRLRLQTPNAALAVELPQLELEVDADRRRARGLAPADALVDLAAITATGQPPTRLSTDADAGGRWSVDLLDRGNGLSGVDPARLQALELAWLDDGLRIYRRLELDPR